MSTTTTNGAAISIHALVKRATSQVSAVALFLDISIHALVKRATRGIWFFPLVRGISIHALVKRATCNSVKHYKQVGYFNPRPREEGDSEKVKLISSNVISIHALVKRATCYGMCVSRLNLISIHALVKRATNAPV